MSKENKEPDYNELDYDKLFNTLNEIHEKHKEEERRIEKPLRDYRRWKLQLGRGELLLICGTIISVLLGLFFIISGIIFGTN